MAQPNTTERKKSSHVRPIIIMAVISFLIGGIFFPLVVTGVAQVVFPYQANGEQASVDGHVVGSVLAANSTDYTLPVFFHLRNDSASGFDPDIPLQGPASENPADLQIARISNATGIPAATLQTIVNQNVQGVWWVFGSPYVNVQQLNLELVNDFPSVYSAYG
jgi:K+-transporting ATPase c subunit